MPIYAKKKGRMQNIGGKKVSVGEMLTPTNLGNPSFYSPLCSESLDILTIMQFPFWQEMLLREISTEIFGFPDSTRWCFQHDGYVVYILVALDLVQIDTTFRTIKNNSQQKTRIICLHWQESFFCKLLEPYAGKQDIWLTKITAGHMADISQAIERSWQ